MNTTHIKEPTGQNEKNKATPLLEVLDLRDYFAAKAMQGLIASPRMPAPAYHGGIDVTDSMVADLAYKMADAMLNAREA